MIYLIIILFICAFLCFCYYENNKIDLTKYEIRSKNVNNDIKIVHLSDLHSKPFRAVLKKTMEIKPDIIVITGDYINDQNRNRAKMLEFGKELIKICPVYYITGNHERRLSDFDALMTELKKNGFNVLLNEISDLIVNKTQISILGLDENQADFKDYKARKNGTFVYKDMSKYFNELKNKNGFKIVLSHFPENFAAVKENNYSKYDFDLQFSGHAHGGQFILPFIGPVFSPGQGLFPKYARGSFGERPKLIISRGLGNAEFPLRLFNHPEINITVIKPQ